MRKTLILMALLCGTILCRNTLLARIQETKLHDAARRGDILAARQQLGEGTNVNARDALQNTPLHVAAYHGKIEVAELLIQKGADVNAYNRNHETPLIYAASHGEKAAVELLLRSGAAVNARDHLKNTALFYAVFRGKKDVMALLFENGADANAVNHNGETALHWASTHGKKEIAAILIQKGATARNGKPLAAATSEAQTAKRGEAAPGSHTFKDPSTGMEFVFVKGGCFRMGSDDADADERPVHTVCTSGFYLGRYEVTQGQWKKIMARNPSSFAGCGDSCPVEKVSWNDVHLFIERLNARVRSAKYRLPTEEEWEYAARAGTESERYGNLDAIAWYEKNSGRHPHEVGKKKPNAWGLYDMLGNVWEWVEDRYGYYTSDRSETVGPSGELYRVARGGSWNSSARDTRSAFRNSLSPDSRNFSIGFRLVVMQPPPEN
jgi:formylglycine-generating enzyme required for sulfatase activity/cellobiose-specific phosphotransferase system component IIA